MEPHCSAIDKIPCTIRQVRWSHASEACPRCGAGAPRVWDVTRIAIDVDLDQPIVLAVEVSVHRCPSRGRSYRAQPPSLRPGAIYAQRVVQ